MTELRNMVKNEGKKYTDFVTYLTISLLDSNGEEAAAWDPVKVNLAASPGDDYYTDAVIKSASYDCGFCPNIGDTYRIKADIYLDNQRILYGTYENVPVAANVANGGNLYQPSPLPDKEELDNTTGTAIANPKPETRGFRYSSTTKTIVVGLHMTELRNMVKNEGKKYTDFVTYLTISLLGDDGEEVAAWDPVKVNLAASPGDDYYTDAVIKSASYDCGFCPKIGNTYRIKASIYLDGQRILYGTYDNVPVAENVKNAGSLYQPSPLPGETNHYELKLGCSFYNTLPGSAAGTVTITTVSESTAGTFGIYWLGKDGGPSPPPWAIKC